MLLAAVVNNSTICQGENHEQAQIMGQTSLVGLFCRSRLYTFLVDRHPHAGFVSTWGPALAALIVVGVGEGNTGVKTWWSKVVQRNTKLGWYVVAASIPLVIPLTAAGLNLVLGAHVTKSIDWTVPLFVLPILLLVSGMWEEPGWTGFALPRLQERFATTPYGAPYGALIATLIMAVIRTGWHLPLMLSGSIYWSDIVGIIAAQIVISWLFNASGGSVLAIMLLHLLNNIMAGEFVLQWFGQEDWVRQFWLLAILWSLLALGVLIGSRQLGAARLPQPHNPKIASRYDGDPLLVEQNR